MTEDMTYIKLYRKVMENAVFLELPYDRWHAFEFLVLKARRFPTITILKGKPIKLEVGQLIYGEDALARKWGWSRGKVKRFLDMLENLEMIKKNGTPYGTVITIENYTKYQGDCSCDDTPPDTPDSTSDGTHKKKDKKDKNDIYTCVPEELKPAFMEFAKMRNKIKKPLTSEDSVKRQLSKLYKLGKTTEEQIAILHQSVDNCWQGLFPVKIEPEKKSYKTDEDYDY